MKYWWPQNPICKLLILAMLATFVSQGLFPCLAVCQQINDDSAIDEICENAKNLSKRKRHADAIKIMEDLRQKDFYKQADLDFKRRIWSLELGFYNKLTKSDIYIDSFGKLIEEILTYEFEFDYGNRVKKNDLLQVADSIKAHSTPVVSKPPQIFQFQTLKLKKAKAGMNNEIIVSTFPSHVPVKFSVDNESESLYFKPGEVEETRAVLIYKPDSTQIGSIQSIFVLGESEGVIRQYEIKVHVIEATGAPNRTSFAGIVGGLNIPIKQEDQGTGTVFGLKLRLYLAGVISIEPNLNFGKWGKPGLIDQHDLGIDGSKILSFGVDALFQGLYNTHRVKPYFCGGIGYYSINNDDTGYKNSNLGFALGLGADINVMPWLNIDFRTKMILVPLEGGSNKSLLITIGILYNLNTDL